jgi:hypothetical protein
MGLRSDVLDWNGDSLFFLGESGLLKKGLWQGERD